MFYAALPVGAEMIVAQAVVIRIYDGFEPSLQHRPLRGIDLDLKDRELNSLTEVAARLGNPPEPPRTARLGGGHVVGHEHHHRVAPLFPEPGRIGIEIAAQMPGEQLGLQVGDEPERRRLLQEGVTPLLLLTLLPSGEHRPASRLSQKYGTPISDLDVACSYLSTVDERKDKPVGK